MRSPRLLPPLVVMLAGLGCAAAPPRDPHEDPGEEARRRPRSVDAMLDATTREIIRHPSAVTVYRLNSQFDEPVDPSLAKGHFQRYTFRQRATPKPEIAQRLAAQLLDDRTYDFDRQTRCIFNPSVGIRFEQGAEQVEVLICYSCDEMGISTAQRSVHFEPGADALHAITDEVLAP